MRREFKRATKAELPIGALKTASLPGMVATQRNSVRNERKERGTEGDREGGWIVKIRNT